MLRTASSFVRRAGGSVRLISGSPLVCAQNVGGPSFTDRVKEAVDISSKHVSAAMKNQKQAADDIASGRADATKVMSEHMDKAKKDMNQWGHELKQAAKGDTLPGSATVRDLPPMTNADDHVADRVTTQSTRQGAAGRTDSQAAGTSGSPVRRM